MRLARAIRLVRLVKLGRLMQNHGGDGASYITVALTRSLVTIVVAAHWLACFWSSLGLVSEDSWISEYEKSKGFDNGEVRDGGNFGIYSRALSRRAAGQADRSC